MTAETNQNTAQIKQTIFVKVELNNIKVFSLVYPGSDAQQVVYALTNIDKTKEERRRRTKNFSKNTSKNH